MTLTITALPGLKFSWNISALQVNFKKGYTIRYGLDIEYGYWRVVETLKAKLEAFPKGGKEIQFDLFELAILSHLVLCGSHQKVYGKVERRKQRRVKKEASRLFALTLGAAITVFNQNVPDSVPGLSDPDFSWFKEQVAGRSLYQLKDTFQARYALAWSVFSSSAESDRVLRLKIGGGESLTHWGHLRDAISILCSALFELRHNRLNIV